MGPRFRKRGNARPIPAPRFILALQWGRAFGSAETPLLKFLDRLKFLTSMGPRFRKRGNI